MKRIVGRAASAPWASRFVAIHEASHYVIARALGLPCGECTIIPEETPRGLMWGSMVIHDADQCRAARLAAGKSASPALICRARIMALMAGGEGVRVIMQREDVGDVFDLADIETELEAARAQGVIIQTASERGRMLARLRARTRHMIGVHRERILMLRDELLAEPTMTADRVEHFLDGANRYARTSHHLHEHGSSGAGGPGFTIGSM